MILSARGVEWSGPEMNAQAKPAEPSMEEILASIRRIIADDEVKPAEEAATEAAPVAVEAAVPVEDALPQCSRTPGLKTPCSKTPRGEGEAVVS